MAFATVEDVRKRLQQASLSTQESDDATGLLEFASAAIAEAADKTVAQLTPPPEILKRMTIELVCRGMGSAQGLTHASETLGAHSRTESYRRSDSTPVLLTKAEEMMVRSAVYGSLSGSSTPRALHDRLIDLAENRDVDEVEA